MMQRAIHERRTLGSGLKIRYGKGDTGGCAVLAVFLLMAGGLAFATPTPAAVTVGPEYTFPGGDNGSCDWRGDRVARY